MDIFPNSFHLYVYSYVRFITSNYQMLKAMRRCEDELTIQVFKENAEYNMIHIQDGIAYERIITTTSRVNSCVRNDVS
jgi:hypothetical protein